MTDGGFLVKFDGKEAFRCYTVSFDYDELTYKKNNEDPQDFPAEGIKKIEIVLE